MSIPKNVRNSRILGSLYGLPVGDALGAPYEFRRRRSYNYTAEMEECKTFHVNNKPLPPGTWTDDTSMALCLGQSLVENNGLVWKDAAGKWCDWYNKGYMSAVGFCFDIGNATRMMLGIYNNYSKQKVPLPDEPPTQPKRSLSGNGSIMRFSPLPAFIIARYDKDSNLESTTELFKQAALSSRITHGSPICVDACILMSAYLLGFYTSSEETPEARKAEVLQKKYVAPGLDESNVQQVMNLETDEIKGIWSDTPYKDWKNDEDVKTSGYTVSTLEAALWALWHGKSFEEGMMMLIPLGDDVDTVCAVYGQLAGACYGMEAIPDRWLNSLQKRDILDSVFKAIVPQDSSA